PHAARRAAGTALRRVSPELPGRRLGGRPGVDDARRSIDRRGPPAGPGEESGRPARRDPLAPHFDGASAAPPPRPAHAPGPADMGNSRAPALRVHRALALPGRPALARPP